MSDLIIKLRAPVPALPLTFATDPIPPMRPFGTAMLFAIELPTGILLPIASDTTRTRDYPIVGTSPLASGFFIKIIIPVPAFPMWTVIVTSNVSSLLRKLS